VRSSQWLWIAVVAVLGAAPARAQDELTNAVGVNLSYATPKDLEQGIGVGLTLTHVVAMLLSFELGVEHYTFDHRDPGLGTITGEVSETPLLVTAQIRPQFGWNPYLGFGVGYYLMSYDQTSAATTLCDCEVTVDNAIAVHFAAGLDVPLDDRLTLTVDVRSASGDADATSRGLSSGVSVSDQLKLDYLKVGAGLKYWF
jgi:outer membrane protein W